MKCSCLILQGAEEFYTTLKLRTFFEVQSWGYIIMNNLSHSQSKVSMAFHSFFTEQDVLCSCVICVRTSFLSLNDCFNQHILSETDFTFNSQTRRVHLSFWSNHDNTDQIKALFQGDTETRRCITEARHCTSSECPSEEAAEWHHQPLPVPNMARTTVQHHDLGDTLLF